jgi:hypothetical protein
MARKGAGGSSENFTPLPDQASYKLIRMFQQRNMLKNRWTSKYDLHSMRPLSLNLTSSPSIVIKLFPSQAYRNCTETVHKYMLQISTQYFQITTIRQFHTSCTISSTDMNIVNTNNSGWNKRLQLHCFLIQSIEVWKRGSDLWWLLFRVSFLIMNTHVEYPELAVLQSIFSTATVCWLSRTWNVSSEDDQ